MSPHVPLLGWTQDPEVYEMLCQGDSVGVFQVESRAQMSMLPRLKPRNFYDLVIEVAIVRPGPIQGDMVHPYLRRRDGIEQVNYPSAELERVLKRTLGIPLFQEQAMKISIVGAGFSPSEADGLRRSLATFKRLGDVHQFSERFVNGMLKNGYERDFAERCFRQIEGFADYGFPESHAASFALLVYVSSWLKYHFPAVFACGLLNSQPMGFYAPAQIVRDARDHGVSVKPPEVNYSQWDCTLEDEGSSLRLGFRQIKGFSETEAETVLQARSTGHFEQIPDLWRHGVSKASLEKLARADAFTGLKLDRRAALWAVRALATTAPPPLLRNPSSMPNDTPIQLPLMELGEHVADDYRTLRMSLKAHPLAVLRSNLTKDGYRPCRDLSNLPDGAPISVVGLVITRQRPGSAKGVMFITLEDETGNANLVVWNTVFDAYRNAALSGSMIGVTGTVQREGNVIHVVADSLVDETGRLHALDHPEAHRQPLSIKSRNFH